MNSSNLIRALRNELGLSQTEFGARLGVSRDVINNIENDRVPLKPALAKLICSQFNVDPDWLETGEGDMFLHSDEVTDLFEFAADLFQNKSLAWVRCLCEYVAQLTPEEQEAAARHIEAIAEMIAGTKEKEQE